VTRWLSLLFLQWRSSWFFHFSSYFILHPRSSSVYISTFDLTTVSLPSVDILHSRCLRSSLRSLLLFSLHLTFFSTLSTESVFVIPCWRLVHPDCQLTFFQLSIDILSTFCQYFINAIFVDWLPLITLSTINRHHCPIDVSWFSSCRPVYRQWHLMGNITSPLMTTVVDVKALNEVVVVPNVPIKPPIASECPLYKFGLAIGKVNFEARQESSAIAKMSSRCTIR